jgi:CRP/FNR family transcriptional regulator, cyclic AMP receptor protein
MEIIELLKNNELFNDFSELELKEIRGNIRLKKVDRKKIVIHQDTLGSDLYLIKSGLVDIRMTDFDGNQMIIASLEPGDFFGELAVFDGKPRGADVLAKEDCELVVIHQSEILNLIEKKPGFALKIIKHLCERIRITDSFAHDLATKDVYNRLRSFLYKRAVTDTDGKLRIPVQLTQEEIAANLGCDRVMVSKLISELTKGNYLSIEKKIITINTKLPKSR